MAGRQKKTTGEPIDDVDWDEPTVWALIAEMKKHENYRNTSGETKVMVHKRITAAVIPAVYAKNPTAAGAHVKGKIGRLTSLFQKYNSQLRQTGEGINNENSQGPQETDFVPATGPDHDTSPAARNLWEKIALEWPYFPELYSFMSTRPNITPIAVTTGVGPHGHETVVMQALTNQMSHIDDSNIDPVLLQLSTPQDQPIPAPQTPASGRTLSHESSKENVAPSSSLKHGPKPSSFSQDLIAKASGSIMKVPRKCSFEDAMLKDSQRQFESLRECQAEALLLKKHKLLLAEFQVGIWTVEELLATNSQNLDQLGITTRTSVDDTIEVKVL
ncbi:uncharacterized protein EV420DRAFT_1647294 [Desarmillaria tabescens]|uniref:Myb/SANT-like domain-containing protein n=1 Tax=Armillaria tabescens TaxID=1929756 RepID=A0AA39JT19_ARMTA|nr:uncharacterized protein EV420DRAFT_1647294 [Desarmillaria tabescens]KAK0448405.1 hypothetical protein EV420DRAFT_1647294 [Desarmillaria tabescens]